MQSWLNRNNIGFCSTNFFFIVIMCTFWQLQSMDGPIFDMQADALKIALMIRPDRFNRKMVRCLSQVSVDCSKAIRDTAKYRELYNKDYRALILNSDSKSRKQYFMKLDPRLKDIEGLVWNCFGTVYAKASFGRQLNWSLYEGIRQKRLCIWLKEVMLERRSVFNPNPVGNCAVWENFYDVLPHRPPASFDGNFDVYVHACGTVKRQHPFGIDVLEYRLSLGSITPICMAEINGEILPLAIFLEFPKLLKAFLNSSKTEVSIDFIHSKIFMLKGVELPANYEECKPYHEQARHYTSFEKLPKKYASGSSLIIWHREGSQRKRNGHGLVREDLYKKASTID